MGVENLTDVNISYKTFIIIALTRIRYLLNDNAVFKS